MSKNHEDVLITPRPVTFPDHDGDDIEMIPHPVRHTQQSNLLVENPQQPRVIEQEDLVPDGGYGWICVVCIFWINVHTWGINSAYGVFLAYYLSSSTFPGASSLDYAFIGGLSISQGLLVSPLTNTLTRLTSTRTTLCLGIFLQTLALVGASFATQVWHLFVTQGLCFGWGMGFLYVGSAGIIPQWFSSRRSLASGITAAGAGIGGLIYNLATNAMIQNIGLAWALRVLAICSFASNAICTLLVKDRNGSVKPKQVAFDLELFKRAEFLLILGWGFFSELGYVVLLYSLPNYAISVGLSSQQGSIVGALLNLGLGVGRPIVGHFSDSIGRLNMASIATASGGIMILTIWIFAKSFGILCFFAIFVGMVCGTFWSTVAPVGAEVVGLKNLPSALSLTFLVMTIPTTFAEPIALKLQRTSGNLYLTAQIFTGVMFIAAAFCSWVVRAWKITETDREALQKRLREGVTQSTQTSAAQKGGKPLHILKNMLAWKKV